MLTPLNFFYLRSHLKFTCLSFCPLLHLPLVHSMCAAYTHIQLQAVAVHISTWEFSSAHIWAETYVSTHTHTHTDMGAHKPKNALSAHRDVARLKPPSIAWSTSCLSSIQPSGCFSQPEWLALTAGWDRRTAFQRHIDNTLKLLQDSLSARFAAHRRAHAYIVQPHSIISSV